MSFVLTLISHPADPKITDDILGEMADRLDRAIDVHWLDAGIACDIEITDKEGSKLTSLSPLFERNEIDFAILSQANRRKSGLIADMDSTMIEQECIDELADLLGIRQKVADITERAMRGEIEFEPALRERVSLLMGLPLAVIDDVMRNKITFRSGGRALVQTMKQTGCHTALVSGGFTLFTQRVSAHLGFDEHHANTLLHENGKLTGLVADPILGASAKVAALEEMARRRKIRPTDFLAVGDGANDLPMLEKAGLGVALHAKPQVAKAADVTIRFGDLTALLYLQGYKRSEFKM